MRLPPVRVPRIRKPPKVNLPQAPRPRLDNGGEAELLNGVVEGLEASVYEERYAKSLYKKGFSELNFRYTFGVPRNTPGFFEVDFLPENNGLYYAIEIDSLFTHRKKKRADALHDARILEKLDLMGVPHFPKVFHVLGDTELVDQRQADATVSKLFG